jgi:hypothetical protein
MNAPPAGSSRGDSEEPPRSIQQGNGDVVQTRRPCHTGMTLMSHAYRGMTLRKNFMKKVEIIRPPR